MTAARLLGVSWQEIVTAIPRLHLEEKRLEKEERNGVQFINDSYNACEVSVKAALDVLAEEKGRKIAVLADMLELGSFSKACHESVARHALDRADLLFCYGKEALYMAEVWKSHGKKVFFADHLEEIAELLKAKLEPGDTVLLKGSHSMQVGKILDYIT
jgi:UDP-N-acetylmuramoyl-tripeptide--D-alanyl-D-alanine ligase